MIHVRSFGWLHWAPKFEVSISCDFQAKMSENPNKESIRDLLLADEQSVETILNDIIIPTFSTSESIPKILFTPQEISQMTKNPLNKIRFIHYQILVLFLQAKIQGEADPFKGEIYQQILMYLQMVLPITASLSENSMQSFIEAIEEIEHEDFPQTIHQLEIDVGFETKDENEQNSGNAVPQIDAGKGESNDKKRKHYGNAIKAKVETVQSPLRVRGDYTSLRRAISNDRIEVPRMVKLRIKKPHTHEKKKSH